MRSHHRRLDSIFRAAVSTLGLASLAGCGGTAVALPGTLGDSGTPGADGGGIDPGTFTSSICPSVSRPYEPLTGLTPAQPVDYIELRSEQVPYPGQADAGPNPVYAQAKEGTPCKTATNATACNSDLGMLRSQEGWKPPSGMVGPTIVYLVFTRGDKVGKITSAAELTAFLGPIDSPKDAALLVTVSGAQYFECTGNNVRPLAGGGYELLTTSGSSCGAGTHVDQHVVRVSASGAVEVVSTVRLRDGDPQCSVGRRPEGLVARFQTSGQSGELGDYLANVAHLEAASVYAFEQLARELRAHNAPMHLVRAAERARADEVRHARTTSRLAVRAGGTVIAPVVTELPVRGLLEIALENATEGCVRETFGALVAQVQASKAEDHVIARAMRVIARDETRHAALAWDVAEWIAAQLTEDEQRDVALARQEAARELRREVATDLSHDIRTRAGVPSGRESLAIVDAVTPELWAA